MITENGEIICHTTPWYHRRRLIMIAMFFGLAAYFAYDWKVGYPKKQADYEEYWPVYQKMAQTDLKGYTDMATAKGWPKDPKETDWNYKLKEQLIWAIGMSIAGAAMLVAYLRNKNRTLKADDVSFTTPDGVRIPFASVEKVDKRKWDNKALAYAYWRKDGAVKKATIDDLVFDDAGKVFDRLMANFQGELVDIERSAAEDENPEDSAKGSTEAGPETAAASAAEASELPAKESPPASTAGGA